ncbi:MAG: cupin domain-containing protein [Bacteroidales bacterium]|nr:cupin domain-containing protein [Bacteroidales bacterium]
MIKNMNKQIGNKVRQIRENLKISIEELSERSSLNVDQIAKIESNEIIPSLAPLIRISRALGVRLGTFMDDNENLGPALHLKDQSAQGISFSNNMATERSAMQYFPLAAEKAGRHMEPFIIEIKANADEYILSTHEGEEFIYVLEGELEIVYGKEKKHLTAGDSIYYDSIVPHHVHAAGNKNARILAVVYVPL